MCFGPLITDAASLKTTAKRVGDHYVLNGSKVLGSILFHIFDLHTCPSHFIHVFSSFLNIENFLSLVLPSTVCWCLVLL